MKKIFWQLRVICILCLMGSPIKNSFYNRKYLAYNYYPKYKPIDAVLNSNLYL